MSSSYDAMETMFQQAGVPPPSVAGSRKVNMEMRTDGECPRMCLQIVESRKMQFGFLDVGEKAWKFLLQSQGGEAEDGFQMVRCILSVYYCGRSNNVVILLIAFPEPRRRAVRRMQTPLHGWPATAEGRYRHEAIRRG